MTEGYGISSIDNLGFPNVYSIDRENYILAVGSSHFVGLNLGNYKKCTDILNSKGVKTYNISKTGFWLTSIVKNFKHITYEFKDSKAIIIETPILNYLENEMIASLEQQEYDEKKTADYLINNISLNNKLKHLFKSVFPIYSLIIYKGVIIYEKIFNVKNNDEGQYARYATIENVIKKIRSEYDKQIIIVSHPQYKIVDNEKLYFEEDEYSKIYKKICNDNGIDFIDMTDIMQYEYKINHKLFHGFNNTSFTEGHLNYFGSKLIANEIERVLNYG